MTNDFSPPDKRGGPPRNQKARTAKQMLEMLEFDPIVELVKSQRRMAAEAELFEDMRNNKVVLLKADGSTRPYSFHYHHTAITESARMSKELLDYAYKKAAQEDAGGGQVIPFEIHVTAPSKSE